MKMKYRYKTETLNVVWIKAADELPPIQVDVYFQLVGSKEIKDGVLDYVMGTKQLFYTNHRNYQLYQVSHWCYPPQLKGVK
jgi:hypothetical protein